MPVRKKETESYISQQLCQLKSACYWILLQLTTVESSLHISVCTVIVLISLAVERTIHLTGKYLNKRDQRPLFEALQKIKEELMLLGFISLLLTVLQNRIAQICISESLATHWLPCRRKEDDTTSATTSHFQSFFFSSPIGRRLLSESSASIFCTQKRSCYNTIYRGWSMRSSNGAVSWQKVKKHFMGLKFSLF